MIMNQEKIESYKDLIVWQKAMELVVLVYSLTRQYPKEELYVITSQMRRSAISIPSNIAEGKRRGTRKEYCRFLTIAYGSSSELETQLMIGRKLLYGKDSDYEKVEKLLIEVLKMLNKMISSLRR